MTRVIVTIALLVSACERRDQGSSPSGVPSYVVASDPASLGINLWTHVPGSRGAEEAEALRQFLALYPPDEAERLAGLLADTSTATVHSVADPEAARLLSIIYSIRDADAYVRVRARNRELARTRHIPLRVSLVLVDDLAEPAAIVRWPVQRSAGQIPDGRNAILLNRSKATPELLAAALNTLYESWLFVLFPQGEERRSSVDPQTPEYRFTADLVVYDVERLLRAAPVAVVGVGTYPSVDLVLSP